MTDVSPGWYKDPAEPGNQRYWDGEGWIGEPLPADAAPPPGPPPVKPSEPSAPTSGNGVPTVAGPPPVPTYPPEMPAQPQAPAQPPAPGQPMPPGQSTAGRPDSVPLGPSPGWPYPPGRYLTRMPMPRPHGLPLATPGARFVARVIDIGVLALLNLVVNGWFIWQYAKEISPTVDAWELYITQQTNEVPENSPRSGYLNIVIILIAAALWLAYEVPSIANTGQTFGKRVLGIQVVRLEEPGPIGFARSLRRWNTLGLPTLLWPCCGIGFILQFVDSIFVLADRPLMQALHDKSARTVVVSLLPPGAPGQPTHRHPAASGGSHPSGSQTGPNAGRHGDNHQDDAGRDETKRDDTKRDDTPGGAA